MWDRAPQPSSPIWQAAFPASHPPPCTGWATARPPTSREPSRACSQKTARSRAARMSLSPSPMWDAAAPSRATAPRSPPSSRARSRAQTSILISRACASPSRGQVTQIAYQSTPSPPSPASAGHQMTGGARALGASICARCLLCSVRGGWIGPLPAWERSSRSPTSMQGM